ncbi:NUDIX hydrolase [Rosettibacter firmus]|uniref:NUDIX hydrolase n=1 Tax=Rosettibacter firmus TaxID=3111522 RepID=UPI00336BD128
MKIKSSLVEVHIIRKIKDDIEFLLLKRSKEVEYPDLWQMVTGSIEKGEEFFQTALRELNEETGLKPIKLWLVPNINSYYEEEKKELNLIHVFVALVNKNNQVKISNEHTEFMWVDKKTAKQLVAWDGQRKSMNLIYDFFINKKNEDKFLEIKF